MSARHGWVVLTMLASGCFSAEPAACSVTYVGGSACPSGLVCDLTDSFCHPSLGEPRCGGGPGGDAGATVDAEATDARVCPAPYVRGPSGQSCYLTDLVERDHASAAAACATAGAHLVVIDDDVENDYVAGALGGAGLWIGLERASDGAPWYWATGDALTEADARWDVEDDEPERVSFCANLNDAGPGALWDGKHCLDDAFGHTCELDGRPAVPLP